MGDNILSFRLIYSVYSEGSVSCLTWSLNRCAVQSTGQYDDQIELAFRPEGLD